MLLVSTGSVGAASSARASRRRQHDSSAAAAAAAPSPPTARAAAAADAATAPRPLAARLTALGRRVRVACAYKPEEGGDSQARAARLLSAPGGAAAVPLPPPSRDDAATTPPAALLARLRDLLPAAEEDAFNPVLQKHHHHYHHQQQLVDPLLTKILDAWRGGVRRSSPPLTPREADGAALAAADLLRACALLRLHPRRDPRAARCLELATHAVATRACSPAAVAAALAAWGAAFASSAARPTTPIRPFFGALAEPGGCASVSDDALLVRVALTMARLPARRGALEAVGLELERRLEEQEEGGGRVGVAGPSLLLLPRLPQLLRRGLPPSCAAAVLRAASVSADQLRPQDAWALLLALRPLVPSAGGEQRKPREDGGGEREEDKEEQGSSVVAPAAATAAAEEAVAERQQQQPSPDLLPRPQWSPPSATAVAATATAAAAAPAGDDDNAAAADAALAVTPSSSPTTMDDVKALAEDLARGLARRARQAPPPLRAAPPLPAGLEAALAEEGDGEPATTASAAASSSERREAALRAAEDILSARLDQLAAALPLCEAASQVLAACEGAVRALAIPTLAAAAARSPRCRASAAALLRAVEAAAFCEAAGALDLAQRMLLLRSLDALRWAANADVHVSGFGGVVGGGGAASSSSGSSSSGATVPLRDDAFTSALRQDLARDLAVDAPLCAVASALNALAALRLPPPAALPAVSSSEGGGDVEEERQQPPPPQQQPGWDSVALLRLLVARLRPLPLASSAPLLQAMAALGYAPPRAALDYFLEPFLRDRHQSAALAAAAGATPSPFSSPSPAQSVSSSPPPGALDAIFALGSGAASRADAEAVHRLLLALGGLAENERARRDGASSSSSSSTPPEPPLISRRALKRVLLAHAAASAPRLGPRSLLAAADAARLAAFPFYPATPGDVWLTAWSRRLRACAAGQQLSDAQVAEAALLLARLDWAPQPGMDAVSAPRRSLAWQRALWSALEPSRRQGWGPALASMARARLEPLQQERQRCQVQVQRLKEQKKNKKSSNNEMRAGRAPSPPSREAEAERRALLWAALKHGLGPSDSQARLEWTRAFLALAARAGPSVAPHVAADVLASFARGTFAGLRRERLRLRQGEGAGAGEKKHDAEASVSVSPALVARLRRHVTMLAATVAEGAGSLEGGELVRALRALRAAEAALRLLLAEAAPLSSSSSTSLAPMPLERRRAVLSAALDRVRRMTNPPPAAAAALLDLLASGPLRGAVLLPASAAPDDEEDEDDDARLARRADASLARAWVNHLCALAVGVSSELEEEEEEEGEEGAAAAAAADASTTTTTTTTTTSPSFFPPWAPQSRRWKRTLTAAALLRALRSSPGLTQALVDGGAPTGPLVGSPPGRWGAALLLASAAEEPAGAAASSSSLVASDLSAAVTSAAFLEAAGFRGGDGAEEESAGGSLASLVLASALAPSSSSPQQQLRPRDALALLPPSAVLAAAEAATSDAAEMLAAMAELAAGGAAAAPAAALPAAAPLAAFGRRAASWALLRALSGALGRVGRAAASSAALASRGRAAFERAVVDVDGTAMGLFVQQEQQAADEATAAAAATDGAAALWAEASRAALELRLARLLREAVAASSSRLAAVEADASEKEEEEEEDDSQGEGEGANDAAEDDDAALLRVFALGNGSSLMRALDLRMASLARRAIMS